MAVGLLWGCNFRLVDFTAISSKNVALDLALAKKMGKRTSGSRLYFLGIYNLKDSLDEALEKAGPNTMTYLLTVLFLMITGFLV